MGCRRGVLFPAGEINFSLPHSTQTGYGAQHSIQRVPGSCSPRAKRLVREAEYYSSPSSAEVKNGEDTSPLPHTLHVVVLNHLSIGTIFLEKSLDGIGQCLNFIFIVKRTN
jgi:hypothetical protein